MLTIGHGYSHYQVVRGWGTTDVLVERNQCLLSAGDGKPTVVSRAVGRPTGKWFYCCGLVIGVCCVQGITSAAFSLKPLV